MTPKQVAITQRHSSLPASASTANRAFMIECESPAVTANLVRDVERLAIRDQEVIQDMVKLLLKKM
jgi:hypothetical protein